MVKLYLIARWWHTSYTWKYRLLSASSRLRIHIYRRFEEVSSCMPTSRNVSCVSMFENVHRIRSHNMLQAKEYNLILALSPSFVRIKIKSPFAVDGIYFILYFVNTRFRRIIIDTAVSTMIFEFLFLSFFTLFHLSFILTLDVQNIIIIIIIIITNNVCPESKTERERGKERKRGRKTRKKNCWAWEI